MMRKLCVCVLVVGVVVVPVGSELASAQKGINKEAENEGDGDNCYVPDTALDALVHILI